MIADDEPDIHAVTRLSLKPLSRKLGPTEFVSAASGKETLALLEQTHTNKVYWYVLVADQQSYFSYVPPPLGTNHSPTNPSSDCT